VKLKQIAQLIALIGVATPAVAQEQASASNVQRVEITGSSIKRIAREGALPVQTITSEEIQKAGITSAEQLVSQIASNGNGAYNLSSQQGFVTSFERTSNGQSNANLRGLGAANTLVLLNGRRVATHGLGGKAVDLNSIPLAAISRVEVLKDGASAIYGTDAIGGVINFILRKDYKGVEATAFTDITEAGGGNIHRVSVLGGAGDLDTDGYNIVASLTFDRNEKLRSKDRDFASNGYQPWRGLSPDTTGTPYANIASAAGTAIPASFRLPGDPQLYNRANLLAFQGKCDSVPGMSPYATALWKNPGSKYACAYDYGADTVLMQPVERANFVSRGTFRIAADTTGFVEFVASNTRSTMQFTQSQFTTANYPVGGPYYQDLSAYVPNFDRTKPIRFRWRCIECGPRTQETTADAFRLLAGLEGNIAGWDYRVGLSGAGSKADTELIDGYTVNQKMIDALQSGKINPWLLPGQAQTAEAMALIEAAKARGGLFGGKTRLGQLDGTISREWMQLGGGALATAFGFDLRRESYAFKPSDFSNGGAIKDAGGDPLLPKASRTIKAVYTEAILPLTREFEAQVAVRHDRYSDFGNTTNPKVALRWQPFQSFMVRASANKGFHAPEFLQLYSGEIEGLLNNAAADPELCPKNPGNPDYCAVKFNTLSGGNKNLKPEKSESFTLGFVLSPLDWATATVDLWQIKRTDRILQLDPRDVLANYQSLPENILRGPDGQITHIRGGWVNSAGDETRGIDLGLAFAGKLGAAKWNAVLDGTYIDSFKTRVFRNLSYTELVGEFGNRDFFVRWKHNLKFTYSRGDWSTTLTQNYTHSYKDQKPLGTVPAGFDPKVKAYVLYNLSATYSGFRNLKLTAGIKNLFDTDPSFSAHNVDDVGGTGWDARVGDPRGRSFTLQATYKFF